MNKFFFNDDLRAIKKTEWDKYRICKFFVLEKIVRQSLKHR
jgi:hypothetical protein